MEKNQKIEKGIIGLNIGNIVISATSEKVIEIGFDGTKKYNENTGDILSKAVNQISEYFKGKRVVFDIPYDLPEPDFKRKVLTEILKIPYGKTASYKQIAERIGHPRSHRAVGSVCSQNKLPIIVPCHRVIHSDGRIGNYQGGSKFKEALLSMENNSNID